MAQVFDDWMANALALTRSGQLGEATRAIQQALGAAPWPDAGAAAPATNPHNVIDVQAREVMPDAGTPLPRPPRGSASTAAGPFAEAEAAAAAEPPARRSPSDAPAAFGPALFSHRLGQRAYHLFVPAGSTGQGLPLVVMLHGCQQTAVDFAQGTGMNAAAQAQGFCVLYPEQATAQNPQRCWNWFKHSHQQRARGEPALLAALVRDVVDRLQSDAGRVYVAGLSAGGAMAAILGQTHPDLFAAVGVHSGLPAGAAHDLPSALAAMQGQRTASMAVRPGQMSQMSRMSQRPQMFKTADARPVPLVIFHGDRDQTVAPANAAALLATCEGEPRSEAVPPGRAGQRAATRTRLHDAQGQVVAEQWLVHGAGHAWSGGQAVGSYTDPNGPDATAEMLRFFARWRLEGAA